MSPSTHSAPVSVVIPCYRTAETIGRAVASVYGQSQPPRELVLVDDYSDDQGRTTGALHELAARAPEGMEVKVLQLPQNGGPSVARNTGWEAATQPYIAFLDNDDAWHLRKVQLQYGWMSANPEYALSGHLALVCSTEGSPQPELSLPLSAKEVGGGDILLKNRFSTTTVMLRRNISLRFAPDMRYAEDYLLWMRVVLSGQRAACLDAPLAFLYKGRYGQSGLSADLWAMERGELDSYCRVWREGYISTVKLAALYPYSLAKYLRRRLLPRRD